MGCGKMGTSLFDSRSDDRQGDDNTTHLAVSEPELKSLSSKWHISSTPGSAKFWRTQGAL